MNSSGNPSFAGVVPVRPHRNPSDFNNKIILATVIPVSLVVVLLGISLYIYARCRRRRITFLVRADSLDLAARRIGLHTLPLTSLPLVVFRNSDLAGAAVECAVCLSAVEDGETVRVLPNCKHVFHSGCIDMWFDSHSTCPICRTELAALIVPEPREAPAAEGSGESSFRSRILSRESSSGRIEPWLNQNTNDAV